jgi:SSS family solute:Na+ symporter
LVPQITFRTGDIVVIALYFLAMILLGVWTTRKIKKTEDFFVGGRSMPGWAIGFSLLGTAISSVTFLAYPGSAYQGNWSRIMQGLMLPVAVMIGIYFFIIFYRRSLFLSAYEYFQHRFGHWTRNYTSLVFLIGQIFRIGSVLFLVTLAMEVLTGWSLIFSIILVGFILTFYTVLGGLEAVVWTDVAQTFILVGGGLLTIFIVFIKVNGGIFEVFHLAAVANKFDLTTSWNFDLTRDTFWVFAFSGIMNNIQELSTDQVKIQRYAAPSTDSGARRATWMVGLGCIPIWVLFMLVGTCLWVFYQVNPSSLPMNIKADQVFPHFIVTQLPVGLSGFVIAALLAAAMSTISSGLNASASVVSIDWYQRYFVRNQTDKHYLRFARIITVVLGVFMMFAAWALSLLKSEAFLDIGFFIGAVFAGGLGGLFLLGFFFKHANNRGALVGVIFGVIVILWLTLSNMKLLPQSISSSIHPFMISVAGNVTVLTVGVIASLFWPAPTAAQLERVTWWTRPKK